MLEWAAYWRLEPPLATRMEYGLAMVAATLANIHRNPKKRTEPFSAMDFVPQWGATTPEDDGGGMEPERVMAVMDGLMREQDRREARIARKTTRRS